MSKLYTANMTETAEVAVKILPPPPAETIPTIMEIGSPEFLLRRRCFESPLIKSMPNSPLATHKKTEDDDQMSRSIEAVPMRKEVITASTLTSSTYEENRLRVGPRLEKCLSENSLFSSIRCGQEHQQANNGSGSSKSEGDVRENSQIKTEEGEEVSDNNNCTTQENCVSGGIVNKEAAASRKEIGRGRAGGGESGDVVGGSCCSLEEDHQHHHHFLSTSTRMTGVKSVSAVAGGHHHHVTADGLIMPKRLHNPCLESTDRQNLHKELMLNQKLGKNVLNQKSELQRVMEKRKENKCKKELELQKQENMTPLEKVIEQRARRLEILEKDENEKDVPVKEPEFLQIHAKLRARMESSK